MPPLFKDAKANLERNVSLIGRLIAPETLEES